MLYCHFNTKHALHENSGIKAGKKGGKRQGMKIIQVIKSIVTVQW